LRLHPQEVNNMENKWFGSNASPARLGKIGAGVAGFIALTLLFVPAGCSKSSSSNSSTTSSIPTPSPQLAPAASTPPAVPVTAQPSAPKKVVHRRPTVVSYSDKDHGVSFRYPRKYALKTGEDAQLQFTGIGPVPMNFVQPGGVTLAAVTVPAKTYPRTDFRSGFLNVSVNKTVSESECSQFALPTRVEDDPVTPRKVKVGGMEFDQIEMLAEQGSTQADAKYYHAFENGACYEFALGVETSDTSDDQTNAVDREQVFHTLEKMLATVKINPVAVPEVASGSTTVAPEKTVQ
jgi:hypothetical protein